MGAPTLKVKIISPEKTLFEGEAEAVTGFNNKGKFDILPLHHNFISKISNKITVTINQAQNQVQHFDDIQGVLRCFNNDITVYLGI